MHLLEAGPKKRTLWLEAPDFEKIDEVVYKLIIFKLSVLFLFVWLQKKFHSGAFRGLNWIESLEFLQKCRAKAPHYYKEVRHLGH